MAINLDHNRSITSFLGLIPTSEQKSILNKLKEFFLSSSENFFIIDGSAGTGKTVMMAACSKFLAYKKISYNLAAPTGRAARILSSKTNLPCSTIHSLIYEVDTDPEEGTIRFNLKQNDDKDYTIFIIDEASMVSSDSSTDEESLFASGNRVLEDLIFFIKEGNELNKVVFIGDKNQLPPVKEKISAALSQSFLQENFNLTGSYHRLTMVRRQDVQSELYKYINNIKANIEGGAPKIHSNSSYPIYNQAQAEIYYVIDFKDKGHEYCTAIAYNHSKNQQFNNNVRSYLFNNPREKLVPGDLLIVNRTIRKSEYTLYNGDHVLVKEVDLNNREKIEGLEFVKVILVAKNLQGEEIEIKDYFLLDSLDNPKGFNKEIEKALHQHRRIHNKVYNNSGNLLDDPYLGAIRALYGYSITIHKAQGGEWDKVYISDWYPEENRFRSKYTAFTRAKEEVFVYN